MDEIEKRVEQGEYASKGEARRALGVHVEPVQGLTPSWHERIRKGIAGGPAPLLSVR